MNFPDQYLMPQFDVTHSPISRVLWVPVEKVFSNSYNPNHVPSTEMKLLYISIKHDGYTQPVVCVYDEKLDKFTVVDGFHRTAVMKRYKDIYEQHHGLLPVVVIDKPINDRMAATIRHNRARGKHSVAGMSSLVMELLNRGWSDRQVCAELGLEKEELIRLKHVTGYAKFYENSEFTRARESRKQIEERLAYEREGEADGE